MDPEEKLKLQARGVGITKSLVFVEEDQVHVSTSDFFEGEVVSCTAFSLDTEEKEKSELLGVTSKATSGNIAGSEAKTCGVETVFDLPDTRLARVHLIYLEEERTIDITPKNTRMWISWV